MIIIDINYYIIMDDLILILIVISVILIILMSIYGLSKVIKPSTGTQPSNT